MTKYTTNTFKKLDTDTSFNKQEPSSFCDAVDLRLISDEALSNGALVNFKGTKAKIDLTSNYQVKGYSLINDTLALLLYHAAEDAIVEHSAIASVELDNTNTLQTITILYLDDASTSKLNFGEVEYISCVGRYENDNSKKVYFAVNDGETPLRYFNLIQEPASLPISSEANLMDIVPNNTNPSFTSIDIIDGGLLQAGRIQYSCRLFKKYGAETSFSPTSDMISLTKDGPKGFAEFTGSDIETSVNKSVSVSIENLDQNYDYVSLYSIFYAAKDTPIVKKVSEIEIPPSGNVTIVDNGTSLGLISIDEFNTFGGRLFSAETLAVKNNMLFAANLTESSDDVDIDCRAYRFKLNGPAYQSIVYESDGSYYKIEDNGSFEYYNSSDVLQVGHGGINWALPSDADCINKYNDEFLQPADISAGSTPLHPYKYDLNKDGSSFGGSGKYISYTIETFDEDKFIDANGNTIISVSENTYEYSLKSSSRKRGETYREGITFYDKKGKPFFTKWIGDIRIPYTTIVGFASSELIMSSLRIAYNIDLSSVDPAILAKISGFHISSVERTQADQSILCQGATWVTAVDEAFGAVVRPLMHKSFPLSVSNSGYVDTADWEVTGGKTDFKDVRKNYVHPLYSPELHYNGGIDFFDGSYIAKVTDVYVYQRKSFTTNPVTGLPTAITDVDNASVYSSSNMVFPLSRHGGAIIDTYDANGECRTFIGGDYTIVDSFKMNRTEIDNSPYIINYGALSASTEFYNRVLPYNKNRTTGAADHMTMYGPTCGLFSTRKGLAKLSDGGYVHVVDIYKDNASTRYGGNTYEARALNVYHPNSSFVEYVNPELYGPVYTTGDSYNNIFDCLTSFHDPNANDSSAAMNAYSDPNNTYRQQVVSLIPIESKINCALASVKPSKYIFNSKYASGKNTADANIGLQETETQGVNLYGTQYPTFLRDTNAYNTVYSQFQQYPTLVCKPTIFEPSTKMPATIVSSEIKINGELVDNWTKFLYNNVIDVDSSFGDIHNLQHFNNKLYFFQDDGIGIASVLERYILNQDKPSQLALGTGGILERYDYIKYNEGISDQRHIVATNDSIYYLDTNRRVLTDINSTTVPLSVLHGVNSMVRSAYDNIDESNGIAFGYNPVYKEVMFTIGDKTMVFNEHLDLFGPRHTATPSMYLTLPSGLYSFVSVQPQPISFSVSPLSNTADNYGVAGPIEIYSNSEWFVGNSAPSLPPIVSISSYIFKHDVGEYGEMYSESLLDQTYRTMASVSFVVNPNNTNINVFDNLDFRTDITDSNNADVAGETVTGISFKNSYQGLYKFIRVKPVVPSYGYVSNTSRRGRAWTTSVPMVQDKNNPKLYSKRFVDSHLVVTMMFQNNANKKFRLHDVITYYRGANKSR